MGFIAEVYVVFSLLSSYQALKTLWTISRIKRELPNICSVERLDNMSHNEKESFSISEYSPLGLECPIS